MGLCDIFCGYRLTLFIIYYLSGDIFYLPEIMEPTTHESKPTGQPEKVENQPTDFKRHFLASTGTFLLDENNFYRLEADHARKLIFLTVLQTWQNFSDVPTLGQHLRNIAGSLVTEFGLIVDLKAVSPDHEGVILAPAIPDRGVLLDAGLTKVANVIPHNATELISGAHSLSVNSVKIRPFHGRAQAENWLTFD